MVLNQFVSVLADLSSLAHFGLGGLLGWPFFVLLLSSSFICFSRELCLQPQTPNLACSLLAQKLGQEPLTPFLLDPSLCGPGIQCLLRGVQHSSEESHSEETSEAAFYLKAEREMRILGAGRGPCLLSYKYAGGQGTISLSCHTIRPSTPESSLKALLGAHITFEVNLAGDRKPVSMTTAYSWWPSSVSSSRKIQPGFFFS